MFEEVYGLSQKVKNKFLDSSDRFNSIKKENKKLKSINKLKKIIKI